MAAEPWRSPDRDYETLAGGLIRSSPRLRLKSEGWRRLRAIASCFMLLPALTLDACNVGFPGDVEYGFVDD